MAVFVLEDGADVEVDLHAAGDFDDLRGLPLHSFSSDEFSDERSGLLFIVPARARAKQASLRKLH